MSAEDETTTGAEETSDASERSDYGAIQRRLRQLCGLSCAQLADAAGLSWSSVSRYESRGRLRRTPTAETLDKLFSVYGAHPACAGWLVRPLLDGDEPALEAALASYLAKAKPRAARSSRG